MVLYKENEQPGKVHKLCWTLKEPLTIRKQEGRDFSLLLLWLIYCLSGYLSSWSDYLFSRLCCHCWEYAAILLQRILRSNQVTRIKSSKKIDDRLYPKQIKRGINLNRLSIQSEYFVPTKDREIFNSVPIAIYDIITLYDFPLSSPKLLCLRSTEDLTMCKRDIEETVVSVQLFYNSNPNLS